MQVCYQKNPVQEKILTEFLASTNLKKLKEIAEKVGLDRARTWRILTGAEMKLSEAQKFIMLSGQQRTVFYNDNSWNFSEVVL